MKKGFTLVEILLVVLILGILSSILIPFFHGAMQKARQKSTMNDINAISKAVMSFVVDQGVAPDNPDGALERGQKFVKNIVF